MGNSLLVEDDWGLLVVGLDTADVVGLLATQVLHQCNHRVLEKCACGLGPLGRLAEDRSSITFMVESIRQVNFVPLLL